MDDPFNALCAHDYMAAVHTLGVAATTSALEDKPVVQATGTYHKGAGSSVPTLDVILARLEAATRIVNGWPDTYVALLGEVEGRNTEADGTTIAGAFATSIGRLLVSPIRGADGLPLRFLCQAVDRYWDNRGNGERRRRRRRNPSTHNTTAKRLHALFNITDFARAVSAPHGTAFLGRVLARVLECLSDGDRALDDDDLACLVRERAVALYRASVTSLSSETAKDIVEGATGARALSGWQHPRLMPASPALHNLRLKGKSTYALETVEATLARLRAVACRVEHPGRLSPLTSVGLRRNARPWYNKTDILLDVMEGRLAVYATVDAPTLSDLLVNLDDLRQVRCARSPVNRPPGGLATQRQVNVALQGHFGPAGRLTLNEFRRLARGSLVRCQVVARTVASQTLPHKVRLYDVEEVVEFVRRRMAPGGLPAAEAATFGRVDNIGPLLTALQGVGMTTSRMEVELAAKGVKTQDGASWGHKVVAQALGCVRAGGEVPGLLTGRSFIEGLVVPDLPPERADADIEAPCKCYLSDVTDKDWDLLLPYLTLQSEGAWQRRHLLRKVFNGLRYLVHHEVGWSGLPDDLPPWYTIREQARRWLRAGCLEAAVRDLREVPRPLPVGAGTTGATNADTHAPVGKLGLERRTEAPERRSLERTKLHLVMGMLDHALASRVRCI